MINTGDVDSAEEESAAALACGDEINACNLDDDVVLVIEGCAADVFARGDAINACNLDGGGEASALTTSDDASGSTTTSSVRFGGAVSALYGDAFGEGTAEIKALSLDCDTALFTGAGFDLGDTLAVRNAFNLEDSSAGFDEALATYDCNLEAIAPLLVLLPRRSNLAVGDDSFSFGVKTENNDLSSFAGRFGEPLGEGVVVSSWDELVRLTGAGQLLSYKWRSSVNVKATIFSF